MYTRRVVLLPGQHHDWWSDGTINFQLYRICPGHQNGRNTNGWTNVCQMQQDNPPVGVPTIGIECFTNKYAKESCHWYMKHGVRTQARWQSAHQRRQGKPEPGCMGRLGTHKNSFSSQFRHIIQGVYNLHTKSCWLRLLERPCQRAMV